MLSSSTLQRFQRDSKGFLRIPEKPSKAFLSESQLFSFSLRIANILLKTTEPRISHGHIQGYTTEDVASSAVLKLLTSPVYPDITPAYVMSTVRTVLADLSRKPQPTLEFPQVLPENTEEFYDLMSLEDLAEDILRFLHGGQKELFTAVYVDGIPLEDLGSHYGLTERTINRKLYELRLKLTDLLELDP